MADPTRYLLPTERVVINIRRHWAVLAGDSIQSILLLALGILLARVGQDMDFLQMLAVYFCVFVVFRWVWIIGDWYVEKLIVTDKRVLLLTGIVTRKVAIMPLVKVTDLTYNRSTTGLLLGYGQFVVETAGQDQALSHINFVPRPEQLYMQISELLFGGDKGAPGALVTSAQREAEEEADRLARRRWRRFSGRRRRAEADEPARGPAEAPGSPSDRLDDLLARRDTVLLADRDDADADVDFGWGRGSSSNRDSARGEYWSGGDYGRGRYGQPPPGELPIHDPGRRGDRSRGTNRSHQDEGRQDGGDTFRSGGSTLPPPRRPRDEPPPGSDPADD